MVSYFPRSRSLEVELTSKCTLSCVKCPRTKHKADRMWDVGHIDTDNFLLSIDDHINYINFGGAFGDSIYHPDIVEIFQELKSRKIKLRMDTNGSYSKHVNWEKLAECLDEEDLITFSIDGCPENFTQYRVNGDWESIKQALQRFNSSQGKSAWKYIIFKYNNSFDSIRRAYDTAMKLGVSKFMLVHTTRAASGQYVPVNQLNDTINSIKQYVENITCDKPSLHLKYAWTNNRRNSIKLDKPDNSQIAKDDYTRLQKVTDIDPQCINVDNHQNFIGADGIYYPCCYIRADNYKWYQELSFTEQQKKQLSIYYYSINDIVNSDSYIKLINNFHKVMTCQYQCQTKNNYAKENV